MMAYLDQSSPMTLREGLAEFRSGGSLFGIEKHSSPESEAFFYSHDTVHVVYGCDRSWAAEATVKIASIFGTTAGLSILAAYRLHEVTGLYRELSPKDILMATFGAAPALPRAILNCFGQVKRWPWDSFDDRLDQPLNELRSEFGIRVMAVPKRPKPGPADFAPELAGRAPAQPGRRLRT